MCFVDFPTPSLFYKYINISIYLKKWAIIVYLNI